MKDRRSQNIINFDQFYLQSKIKSNFQKLTCKVYKNQNYLFALYIFVCNFDLLLSKTFYRRNTHKCVHTSEEANIVRNTYTFLFTPMKDRRDTSFSERLIFNVATTTSNLCFRKKEKWNYKINIYESYGQRRICNHSSCHTKTSHRKIKRTPKAPLGRPHAAHATLRVWPSSPNPEKGKRQRGAIDSAAHSGMQWHMPAAPELPRTTCMRSSLMRMKDGTTLSDGHTALGDPWHTKHQKTKSNIKEKLHMFMYLPFLS